MADEPTLPDDVLVVRGGLMQPAALLESALDAEAVSGQHAVSVFAGADSSVSLEEVLDLGPVPHARIRTTTVGFVIRRTGRYPHCSVDLGESPSLEIAARLAAVFDPPVPNPRARSQQ